MSMVERALYWIGIIVLTVALIGLKGQISELEAKLSQEITTQAEESEE